MQTLYLIGFYIFSGEQVFVQNKILFLDEHPSFNVDKINNFIESRITYNEDGMKISEWNTDINSVLIFTIALNAEVNPSLLAGIYF